MLNLFYLILFSIPINLGKHFIFDFSYVEGVLIDYAIPTLYLQDLLIFIFLALHFLFKKNVPKYVYYLVPLLLLFTINVLVSHNLFASLYLVCRVILYILFALISPYYFKLANKHTVYVLFCISLLFISFLSLTQWINQQSLFNNYLFFGEQPYSQLTPGILRHSFLGDLVVPPYSLFKHPNVLGGYLSVSLTVLLFSSVLTSFTERMRFLLFLVFFTCLLAIFLTFSLSAWLSTIIGMLSILFVFKKYKYALFPLFFLTVTVFTIGMFGFFSPSFQNSNPSLTRRFLLLQSSVYIFKEHKILGTGLNTNAFLNKDSPFFIREVNFYQPVHNIFWLLLSEGGILVFISVIFVFLAIYIKSIFNNDFIKTIILSQIIILSVFDHYLITSHQMLLLVLLTLSASLNYTFKYEI